MLHGFPHYFGTPQRLLKEARRSAEGRALIAVGERQRNPRKKMTPTKKLLKEAKSSD